MNQRQQNSLSMFKAVATLFQNAESTWKTSEPLSESFTAFQTLLTQIESTA